MVGAWKRLPYPFSPWLKSWLQTCHIERPFRCWEWSLIILLCLQTNFGPKRILRLHSRSEMLKFMRHRVCIGCNREARSPFQVKFTKISYLRLSFHTTFPSCSWSDEKYSWRKKRNTIDKKRNTIDKIKRILLTIKRNAVDPNLTQSFNSYYYHYYDQNTVVQCYQISTTYQTTFFMDRNISANSRIISNKLSLKWNSQRFVIPLLESTGSPLMPPSLYEKYIWQTQSNTLDWLQNWKLIQWLFEVIHNWKIQN